MPVVRVTFPTESVSTDSNLLVLSKPTDILDPIHFVADYRPVAFEDRTNGVNTLVSGSITEPVDCIDIDQRGNFLEAVGVRPRAVLSDQVFRTAHEPHAAQHRPLQINDWVRRRDFR